MKNPISVVFVLPSDKEVRIETTADTLMKAAVDNNIPGILADCGGACSCATCHVYVNEGWLDRLEEPTETEKDMLDFAYDSRPNSRLSCQVELKSELDGLFVRVPERQA